MAIHRTVESILAAHHHGDCLLGVGLGEYFRREKQFVLGEPLANTGIFLPLLAVLGMLIYQDASAHDIVVGIVRRCL